jgi:polysaccharide biosynthesis PFTS motif protein
LGEVPNYNHPDNLSNFVQAIIALKARLERALGATVTLRLKVKRARTPWYDKGYFDYLDALASTGDLLLLPSLLLPSSANLYSVISASHLVVAYPFTSPAYVADALRVPCVFFDPTSTIVREDFSDTPENILFASSFDTLYQECFAALASVAIQFRGQGN